MSAPSQFRKSRSQNGQKEFEKREKRRTIRKLQDAIGENDILLVKEILTENFDVDFQYRGQTSLQSAVKLGCYEICKLLIDAGADVNMADAESNSLLIVACQNNHNDIAELLIQYNADRDFQNSDGNTALNICGCDGNVTITQSLLNMGCDVNICNYKIQSPVYTACYYKHIEIVKLLVNVKDCDINWGDVTHCTPLMLACEVGCLKIVQLLLQAGCEVNKQNRTGETALYIACGNGNNEIVQLLLSYKADTNICTTKGYTPLLTAIRNNHVTVATTLIQGGCDVNKADRLKLTPLHAALKQVSQYFDPGPSKPIELVNLLIKAQVKLDVLDSQGWSPLFQTAFSGETDLCQLLLDIKAPIDDITLKGETILHGAVYGNKEEIVQMFIKAGCPVNTLDKEGHHPLITALLNRSSIEVVKALVEAGSDLNLCEPKEKQSPLHEAIGQHFTQAAVLFIQSGCDINIEDRKRQTPLYRACEKGSNTIVELLLKQPNINLVPANPNVSPLHIACINNHIHVIEKLIEAGYDINMLNFGGLTPFQTALQEDKPNVAKTLLKYGCDIDAHSKINYMRKCCIIYDDSHPHFCLEPMFLALTHKDEEMIEIMLECYDRIPYKTLKVLDTIIQTATDMRVHYDKPIRMRLGKIFQNALRNPRSLQCLCRIRIRDYLRSPLTMKVPPLPVANKIKDFIMMTDVLIIKIVEETESRGWYVE